MPSNESQDRSAPTPATPLTEASPVKAGTGSPAAKPKGQAVAPKPTPYYRQFGHGPKY